MNNSGLVDLVHITNTEDLGSGLPPSTSADAGKVLKVASDGVPGWGEDAMATVDQNYDSTSTHAQSGLAVAQALSDVKEVPAVGSSDGNKVLKATYSGGVGSYSWEDAPASVTVDQSYSASSTNPQSGTAVAEAISGVNQVPTSTTADENKVLKVNAQGNPEWGTDDTVTVDQTYNSSSINAQSGTAVAGAIATVNQVPAATSADENKVLTVNAQGAAGWANPPTELPTVTGNANKVLAVNSGATGVEWVTAQGGSSDVFIIESSTTLGDVYTAYTSGKVLIYKASTGEMYYVSSDGAGGSYIVNLYGSYTGPYANTRIFLKSIYVGIYLNNGQPTNPTQTFGQSILDYTITTSIPLPNIGSGDVGKILQVTNNGLAWSNNVPIEVVASMPASPTAGTLYIVTGA